MCKIKLWKTILPSQQWIYGLFELSKSFYFTTEKIKPVLFLELGRYKFRSSMWFIYRKNICKLKNKSQCFKDCLKFFFILSKASIVLQLVNEKVYYQYQPAFKSTRLYFIF